MVGFALLALFAYVLIFARAHLYVVPGQAIEPAKQLHTDLLAVLKHWNVVSLTYFAVTILLGTYYGISLLDTQVSNVSESTVERPGFFSGVTVMVMFGNFGYAVYFSARVYRTGCALEARKALPASLQQAALSAMYLLGIDALFHGIAAVLAVWAFT